MRSKSIKRSIYFLRIVTFSFLFMILFTGCGSVEINQKGITFFTLSKKDMPTEIVWSPIDKNIILVSVYAPGIIQAEVYLFDLETGQKSLLAESTKGNWFGVAWEVDGNYVLLNPAERTGDFTAPGWWLMNLKDKSLEYLIDPSNNIAWSPDGRTIAILRDSKYDDTVNLIFFDVETRLEEVVYSNAEGRYGGRLSWSPDGHNVVFSLGVLDSNNLYIYSKETRLVTQITNSGVEGSPAWSPTGDIIAFQKYSTVTHHHSLHLIDSSGSCEIEVPHFESIRSPTWSPDGKELAFIGHNGIFVMTLDKVLGRDVYQRLCP
jgi:Tol biopolymer transport system component